MHNYLYPKTAKPSYAERVQNLEDGPYSYFVIGKADSRGYPLEGGITLGHMWVNSYFPYYPQLIEGKYA